MDVPGVSAGASGPDRAVPPLNVEGAAGRPDAGTAFIPPSAGDSVGGLLRELAQSDLVRILSVLEPAELPALQAQSQELVQAVISAARRDDPTAALQQLKLVTQLDPSRAESIASEPALASIRPAVEQLLRQLTASAKLNAEGRLADATRRAEAAAERDPPVQAPNPGTLLGVAGRLIEAGGLANFVRSSAVSDMVIEQTRWAPAIQAETVSAGAPTAESRLPLRWLLVAWFALGLAGAIVCWWLQYDRIEAVFEVWIAGLVVIAALGAWRAFGSR